MSIIVSQNQTESNSSIKRPKDRLALTLAVPSTRHWTFMGLRCLLDKIIIHDDDM